MLFVCAFVNVFAVQVRGCATGVWRRSYMSFSFCKEVACSHSADVSARAASKVSRVSDICRILHVGV